MDDLAVAVTDTGGYRAQGNFTWRRPTIQVLVRGPRGDYDAGYAMALDCMNELHAIADETIAGARYIMILASSDILFAGYDESHRPLFSVNFEIQRTTT